MAAVVDRLRRGYELFNSDGVEGILDLLDPAVVWIPQEGDLRNPYVGHDGVRRWYRSLESSFQVIRFGPEELIVLGDDRILGVVNLHFRAKSSGVEMDLPYANLWTFGRRGSATRVEMFADVEKARVAAGLN